MMHYEIHAATDITGFGLAGHVMKMAESSGVTIRIEESDLPLMAGALEACSAGMVPGGGTRNREFYGPRVHITDEVSDEMAVMTFDPQTSGGLFIALPEADAMKLLADLHELGNTDAAIVGRAEALGKFPIEIV